MSDGATVDDFRAAARGAITVYRGPERCVCGARALIYARAHVEGVLVDLCRVCTETTVRQRRARGQHVPEGFAWVTDDAAPPTPPTPPAPAPPRRVRPQGAQLSLFEVA